MAEEEEGKALPWPDGAEKVEDPTTVEFLMCGNKSKPIMKFELDRLNELVEVNGESMPAIQGGTTAAAAVALPAGPTGQNRWFDASWGYWKYNNTVLKNPLGTDGIPQGNDGMLYWNGTALTWKISKMQELRTTPVTGVVAEGNTDATSGDAVFKAIKNVEDGKKEIIINNWVDGYYYTTGAPNTGNNYSMQRTPLFDLKKGQKLLFGVNTYNTAGSAAIANIYDAAGVFKQNLYPQSGNLNQFFEKVYTATEDCKIGLVDYTLGNIGVRYVKIQYIEDLSLASLNTRTNGLTVDVDVAFEGAKVLDPEQHIPFNLTSYYLTTGAVSGTTYGHKRTDKFLLRKSQILNYGVNLYTAVGSVANLNIYTLEGLFISTVLRPTTATVGTFKEGTYIATQDVLVGMSDYADGNYGTAYATIEESEPINYNKGLYYLLQKDLETDDKFQKMNPSDFEASNIFQRGLAKVNLSATKKYGIIVSGQSNTEGRVPIAQLPSYILNNDNTVPNVMMWNDQTKAFAPFKYGVNTGAGAPGEASTLNLYAYDSIASYLLAQNKNRTIYLVKRAVGGTAIDPSGTNGGGYWTPYTEDITQGRKLVEEFKTKILNAIAANPDLEIKAVLWHQGEGDSTATARVKYYQNFKNVISYIRGIVGNPKLPFIFGTISPLSAQYTAEVHQAQVEISQEDKFVYLIDMSDGTLLDSYHFDATSTQNLGQRMFDVLKNIL
ncbi:sialate O-acetylesterase [Sphingobacterium sp. UGAL515B_05]|uniref:sialate O-acetylesterase n=1 Tax=Sphingobacterium sp. UGAL515B_05 TaxID=2986767 RepID=UPI0029556CC3|nr:sialate O-acetylesterase [Sphingobacterium sp. UGAL515B_05]WON94755.1 sialate O-acetylesterase [Sphingobacterium sp. UGAL515B_05]